MRDLVASVHRAGFRRVLIVNGHGGNMPVGALAQELMAGRPSLSLKFHNWWNAPKTWAKVQEIDPSGTHANWMENFPWTRLADAAAPAGAKPAPDLELMRASSPDDVRTILGDGSFGGDYQKPDEIMLASVAGRGRGNPRGAGGAVAEPILIWGAGAIGGTLGAYWRARRPRRAARRHGRASMSRPAEPPGFRSKGRSRASRRSIAAATPDEVEGVYRRIVLAVKAQHTEAALDALAPHLAADGFVLSAQNGLNELAIARRVGPERTMGCFVNFGADWLGPGRILYGNRGAVVVGEIDGSIRDRTREMHGLLKIFEPDAVLTDDIWGYLWGKLAYGAMLFATALTADSMSANFADPARAPAWLALGREVAAVADARGRDAARLRRLPAGGVRAGSARGRGARRDRLARRIHRAIGKDPFGHLARPCGPQAQDRDRRPDRGHRRARRARRASRRRRSTASSP